MSIARLRQKYHDQICQEVIRVRRDAKQGVEYPNAADSGNKNSIRIAWGMVERLGCSKNYAGVSEQTIGGRFEKITKDFLEAAFELLHHLRPGRWVYSTTQTAISGFDQYEHLGYLEKIIKPDKALASALGTDYIVKPDIIVGRQPVTDEEINQFTEVIGAGEPYAALTSLREMNYKTNRPILHASISCKWTIRSDRSQNTRTEALNLIRNRKGPLPHIVAVTGEPLPTRIAALALGTGDLDCVYHFALDELKESISELDNQDQMDMLQILIEGRRLRDISDLPFDLAI
ncbi:MAG TPA: restriction endonuclease [Desulfobacterales bacterium]|nr:restriction endonuclease [Desulfobacterales bacterium]